MCSSRREFTVIRLNAFENCLYFFSDSNSNSKSTLQTRRINAKLELRPKIKLNKSLFFLNYFMLLLLSLSYSFYRCHYHHHLVYISLPANRRKIFSRFSTSMIFCCRKDDKMIEKRKMLLWTERRKKIAEGLFRNYVNFSLFYFNLFFKV